MFPQEEAVLPDKICIPPIQLSVRALVAFSVPDDAAWSFVSYSMLREGTQAHAIVRKKFEEMGGYQGEVPLSQTMEVSGRTVELSGRADGIIMNETSITIHEVKSTSVPLETLHEQYSPAHWAQLQCYAYLYALEHKREMIQAKLTYYHRATGEMRHFDRVFGQEALSKFVRTLLYPYIRWAIAQHQWKLIRDESIKTLSLPYPDYRKGQKLLAYNVYRTIEDGKRLFAQAPTGTGKTMAVLFPAIKSLAEGKLDRIFYITAKSTTKSIAENACQLLKANQLRLKVLTITAKEKLCLMPVKNCDPDKCPYAEGITIRMPKVVKTLLAKHDTFTRELLEEAGMTHRVCPFELSLDLALGCDLIIADYNYVFDPRTYLKRFFQQKTRENYAILVDEAHNLKDRAQEMYSAGIAKAPLMDLKKTLGKSLPTVSKCLGNIIKTLTTLEKSMMAQTEESGGTQYHASDKAPLELLSPLSQFVLATEPHINIEDDAPVWQDTLVTVFFELLHVRNVLELYEQEYRTLATGRGKGFFIRLICMDPSVMLSKRMDQARTSILFSATLSPLTYYRKLLGGAESDPTLRLPSPFPRENLCVMVADALETRYRLRDQHLPGVARALETFIQLEPGNVMVFFPSYAYMQKVLSEMHTPDETVEHLIQDRVMTEPMRDEYLSQFDIHGDKTRVGFCVLGGVFGEGIDLVGDKLTRVAIVGVGLPQVCPEVELSRRYYDMRFGEGFDYAFVYPGINRVLQAAGRLIRTDEDRGCLFLIDARFASDDYQALLPPEWQPIPMVQSDQDIQSVFEHWKNS